MGLIQTVTQWFYKKETVAAGSPVLTTSWYNAEILNGAQFFLKYTGAVNTTVVLELSPAEANGRDSVAPADAFHSITALSSGNNGAQGFFWPATPSAFDRPFKSWRLKFTAASQITNCVLALCGNGVI